MLLRKLIAGVLMYWDSSIYLVDVIQTRRGDGNNPALAENWHVNI